MHNDTLNQASGSARSTLTMPSFIAALQALSRRVRQIKKSTPPPAPQLQARVKRGRPSNPTALQ